MTEFEEDPFPTTSLGDAAPNVERAEHDPGDLPEFDDSPEALQELLDDEQAAMGLESMPLPPVLWANDRDQPDYAHSLTVATSALNVENTFEFDERVFNLLARANHFQPMGKSNLIVFGLRGGSLKGTDSQLNVGSVSIEDTRPDHEDFLCTLGMINTNTGKINAFAGSTVPNRNWMRNYFKIKHNIEPHSSTRCNMLPTGCYIYRVNAHGGGKIKPALRMTDPDDLTADGACTVLRTSEDLSYSHDDFWDRGTPFDNIHCAYSESSFSSAGCQTIKGKDGQGAWGKFQDIIGGLGWNARIDYVLLTGREAAIAAAIIAAGEEENVSLVRACLERLRVGSQGELVTELQKKLGFNGSGYFGPSTKKRLTQEEAAKGLISDGVFSPEDDRKTGWGVFAAVPVTPPVVAGADEKLVLRESSVTSLAVGEWTETDAKGGLRFAMAPDQSNVAIDATFAIERGGNSVPIHLTATLSSLDPLTHGVGVDIILMPSASTDRAKVPARPAAPDPEDADRSTHTEITAATFDAFAPTARADYRALILSNGTAILARHGIVDNRRRLAHFLAQIGHESGGFRLRVESLNYTSAKRITEVWPSRFPTLASAEPFVRDEEALANNVYGGRLGNSQIGDGFKFRGRGLIQLTGRGAYQDYSDRLGVDLTGNPDNAFAPETALRIAAEYWGTRKLKGERSMNALAESDKLRAITYRINGGFTNFEDREAKLTKAKFIWGDDGATVLAEPIVERGDFNDQVRALQTLLIERRVLSGTVDGKFGFNTYKGLRRFKEEAGLDGVGYADPATFKALQAGRDQEGIRQEQSVQELPVIGDDPEPIRQGISLDAESVPTDAETSPSHPA